MMKRKVLILVNTLSGGGIQKVMQDVANYLAVNKEKYIVTVVALESSEKRTELLDPDIRVISCFRSKATYKRYSIPWVIYILKRGVYCLYLLLKHHDIVLILKDGWYIKLGGMLRAKCKIGWFHTASLNEPHWTRLFFKSDEEEQKCLATYNHIVCVSEFSKQEVEKTIGKVSNLIVIYNPIDVNRIAVLSKEEVSITKKEDHPIFIAVNRLTPIKNTMVLLKCVKKLSMHYSFSLWIVGDGEERKQIEEYVDKNKMTNVTLFGWKKNPYPYIKAADCLISVSAYETFGLTLQEAAVINTPSLAVQIPVFNECAPKSKTILVPNNEEGIYEGLKKILDYPALLRDIRRIQDKNLSHKHLYTDRLAMLERLINEDE